MTLATSLPSKTCMGISKRAFSGLTLCVLLLISGLTGAARSPPLRWSNEIVCSTDGSLTETINGASIECSWKYSGSDTSGADLTITCTGGQGSMSRGTLWDDMKRDTCFSYIKTVTMTNIAELNDGMFRGSKTLKTLDLSGCTELKILPESLCEGCENLTTLNLPTGITSFGKKAFFECSSLNQAVIVSESGRSMGESAFEGSGITSFDASAVPTLERFTIGARGFARCEELTTVTINPVPIKDSLFEGCSKLSKIEIPDGYLSGTIGNRAFFGCSSLKTQPLFYGVSTVGDSAFEGTGFEEFDLSQVGQEIVQEPEWAFGTRMFASCKSLTTVIFHFRLVNLPDGTFEGCSKLSTFEWLNPPESFGSRTFYGCLSLASFDARLP